MKMFKPDKVIIHFKCWRCGATLKKQLRKIIYLTFFCCKCSKVGNFMEIVGISVSDPKKDLINEALNVNPDTIKKAKLRLKKREQLHFCLQEKVCPKCTEKLTGEMDSNQNQSYKCTNKNCDFIWPLVSVLTRSKEIIQE